MTDRVFAEWTTPFGSTETRCAALHRAPKSIPVQSRSWRHPWCDDLWLELFRTAPPILLKWLTCQVRIWHLAWVSWSGQITAMRHALPPAKLNPSMEWRAGFHPSVRRRPRMKDVHPFRIRSFRAYGTC